jgi:outer membrane receptor protein involved in Fe transport
VNAAVYDIEWKNVQTFYFTGEGVVFNVPSARSRGAEVEGQVRPIRPLTLNTAVAYTRSKYLDGLRIPGGPTSTVGDLVIATDGQTFAQPEWTVDFGARYDWRIASTVNSYARVDYRWLKGYPTAVPGTTQYSPDSSDIPGQRNINVRLGFEFSDFDVNLLALNVTDEKKGARSGGRSACAATSADCSVYNTYTYGRTVAAPMPRQIGIQVTYRP